MNQYVIRRATLDDIPILIKFRARMFQTLMDDQALIDNMNQYSESYFRENMQKEDVITWLAIDGDKEAVACSALSFYYLPPKPYNLDGKCGYIFSMYTEEPHRQKGLATQFLQTIIDYAKDIGLKTLKLHASEMGESLYKSFDFKRLSEPEMELIL